ncbi:MAG: hypothetical protein IKR34_08375, partial [Candidatus Gastranaerophilales bacterium]|nr:hypothetical protein [Candidatus Gastranaerophilales bacterium]
DFEGKISDSDKTKLDEQREALKKALDENKPTDELKKLSEDLQQTMYAISQAAYAQVQQEAQNGEVSGNAQDSNSSSTEDKKDDDVIDAEYTKE